MAEDKGHTRRAIAVIGGTPALIREYELVLTNKAEADTLTAILDMEYFDGTKFLEPDKRYEIEIWAGYINEQEQDENTSLSKLLNEEKYKEYLFQRFFGIIDQPRFRIGEDDTITLTARDITGLLMDEKWNQKFEAGQAQSSKVIEAIAGQLTGVELKMEPPSPLFMGKKDPQTGKYVYNAVNKSYWDIVLDVARRTGYNIERGQKTIKLVKDRTEVDVWNFHKTNRLIDYKVQDNFHELEVVIGDYAKTHKDSVYVEVYSIAPRKKSTKRSSKSQKSPRQIIGKYPKDVSGFTGEENVKYIKIVKNGLTQQQADLMAEQAAKDYLKKIVTGEATLPFANPKLYADQAATFTIDPEHPKFKIYKPLTKTQTDKQKVYRINSISETYNEEGFNQRIEIESNPDLELNEDGAMQKVSSGIMDTESNTA